MAVSATGDGCSPGLLMLRETRRGRPPGVVPSFPGTGLGRGFGVGVALVTAGPGVFRRWRPV
jgi:hypothetical protein